MTSVTKGLEAGMSAMRKRAQKSEKAGFNLACRVIASASKIEGRSLFAVLRSVEAYRPSRIDPETALASATSNLLGEDMSRSEDVYQALETLRDLRAIRDDQLIQTIVNAIDFYRASDT